MERRNIILQEIASWRRNKVLPEQYCDFLMNLYQLDHSEEAAASWQYVSKSSIRNSHWKLWVLIGVVIAAASFIVFNFNHFPLAMQIGLTICMTTVAYILGLYKIRANKSLSYALIGSGSILLLWAGQHVMRLHHVEHIFWYVAFFVLCSVIWIALGIIARNGLLLLIGWMGLILFYGWLLHSRIDDIHWVQIQLFWLPLTAIFIWLGWLLQHRNKSTGAVYFFVGLFIWFIPDLYLVIMTETSHVMQLSFMGKIFLASLLLFIFRKKWVEWIA